MYSTYSIPWDRWEAERRLKGRKWDMISRNDRTRASTQRCSTYEFGVGQWGGGVDTNTQPIIENVLRMT